MSSYNKLFGNKLNSHWKRLVLATAAATGVGAFSVIDRDARYIRSFPSGGKHLEAVRKFGLLSSKWLHDFTSPQISLCAQQQHNASADADAEDDRKYDFGGGNGNGNHDNDDPYSYYYEKMEHPLRSVADSHAIFGALCKPGYIERYNTYRRVPVSTAITGTGNGAASKEVCVADIRIGKNLNGHDGIVHGGIISLMIDDSLGWAFEAISLGKGSEYGNYDSDFSMVVTANLTIDYRAPLPAGTDVVIRVRHERTEGRKIYLSARMESYDGKILYSEATSLYIGVKKEHLKQN